MAALLPLNRLDVNEESEGLLRRSDIAIPSEPSNEPPLQSVTLSKTEEEPLEKPRSRSQLHRYGYLFSHYLKELLIFLIPSFITNRWILSKPKPSTDSLRTTAYLDGLRGVASWIVFNSHTSHVLCSNCDYSFGFDGTKHMTIYQLPGFQMLYRGGLAVSIFFVLSGLVLSIEPVKQMNKVPRDGNVFARRLASSIFRRPLRLYLPALASLVLTFTLVRLGYIETITAMMPTLRTLVHGKEPLIGNKPPLLPTIWEQLVDLYESMMPIFYVFDDIKRVNGRHYPYNVPLWTIRHEWHGSLVLFLCHGCLYPMRSRVRKYILIAFILLAFTVLWNRDITEFLIGYLLAECALTGASKSNELETTWRSWRSWRSWKWFLFALAIYLGSFPEEEITQLSWYSWLNAIVPSWIEPSWFFNSMSGLILVIVTGKIPLLKSFLSSGLIQYLGRISFSFYLVHFYFVHGLGELIFYGAWSLTGRSSVGTYIGFFLGYPILLGFVIWIPDMFSRAIERPSVRLGYKLQEWLFKEANS